MKAEGVVVGTRQPTNRQVNLSITKATRTRPRQIETSVRSDTHSLNHVTDGYPDFLEIPTEC